ncbi:ABC transporter substrate-binding protein [Halogeometricum sp. CBA1124]|uniref:ABC transporter substrate-binding protein n=1 Tax=Halogeometricum sp. CBA1124 TaxID=2668071 RepID=UPI0018D26DDC
MTIGTAAVSGCMGGLGSGGGTRTIGAAIPQTGELSEFGAHYERQSEFALSFINEDQERLKMTYEDTQTAPNVGVTAAEKLVNQEGLPMLFAGLSSGVALAVARSVAIPNETLMATGGTSSKISSLDDDDLVFRGSPPTQFQARALATLVSGQDVNSTSVIFINNDFGTAISEEFKASYEELGGTVNEMIGYAPGKSSYKSQLNSATAQDPEGIIFIAYPKAFTVMAKEAYEMGIKDEVRYFANETVRGANVTNNLDGKAINGMMGTQPNPPTNRGVYQQFIEDNKAEFDREPIVWEAYYFDTTVLCGLASVAADSYDSDSLKQAVYPLSRPEGETYTYKEIGDAISALENGDPINYDGVSGSVDLDQRGDVPGSYRRWEVVDGAFEEGDFIDYTE